MDIGSRYDTEQYRRIVSATGDRPDVVVACRKFDDAVTADPAPRRFDPGDAAHARRKANRPPVSDPIEPKHNPAAVATPQPLEDTPAHAVGSQGLTGVGRLG